MTSTAPTFRNLVTSFTDFLTVAIHIILYERGIYPKTSFLSARKYNFAVRQNRHPKVREWINDAIAAVSTEILKGSVDRIAVVIYNKRNKPQERYMFDVSQFPKIASSELDTPMERTTASGEKVAVLPTVDMEEQFRATLSKLANCGTALRPLPEGCTFTVAIELKENGQPPIRHPQPWMPAQPESIDEGEGDDVVQNVTRPVRLVSAGDMRFESWLAQAKDVTGQ